MSKKGMLNIVELITYIIFIIIAAVFIAAVAYNYLNEKIDTTNLETFTLYHKLTDDCLSLKDGIKNHPNTIDLEKLNTPNLISCYSKPNLGYNVKIKSLDGKEIKFASNLDARQEAYLPICSTIKQYKCKTFDNLMLYKDNNETKTGIIEIEVINLVQ